MGHTLAMAGLIFACRLADVSLGTLRMLYTVRGRKYVAGAIGFIEVSIFLYAISSVVGNIGNAFNFIAYSAGFGAGTILGITIEGKLAPGNLIVTIISLQKNNKIADAMWEAGFGVTSMVGCGRDGQREILTSVLRRRDFPALIQIVREIDSDAFITSDQTHFVHRGYLHRIKRK